MPQKIKLDPGLQKRAATLAEKRGYASLDEFVKHLIERELDKEPPPTSDDMAQAKKRLKGLGYAD